MKTKIEVELVTTEPGKVFVEQFENLVSELKEKIGAIRFDGEGAAFVDVKVS